MLVGLGDARVGVFGYESRERGCLVTKWPLGFGESLQDILVPAEIYRWCDGSTYYGNTSSLFFNLKYTLPFFLHC
jgi:hypothetical protein